MRREFNILIPSIVIIVAALFIPLIIHEHTFESVKPGEKYLIVYHHENPFKENEVDTFYVTDVKNGWVKWKVKIRKLDGTTFNVIFSDKKRVFLNITDGKIE